MRLELEVLASTSIKRKKPWPRMAFMGENQESLFLFDSQRLSTLYIPSGKTKRKVPKLSNLLPNILLITHTDNGHFIGGLLKSGDIFLWHKDTDLLRHIQSVPATHEYANDVEQTNQGVQDNNSQPNTNNQNQGAVETVEPHMFIADDGTKLLLVLNPGTIWVWEQDINANFFNMKQSLVKGTWSKLSVNPDIKMPTPENRELVVCARYFINDAAGGMSCSLCMIYNVGDNISITTLMLRWQEQQDIVFYSKPTFHGEWLYMLHPLRDLGPQFQPIRSHGAYLSRHTNDGQVVAVAVNQSSSHDNRVLFVSPQTASVLVSDLKGSGAKATVTNKYRTYWMMSMEWTYDDLFLVCMMKQGTLCILSRLGEPLLIQTFGSSIEMGPKMYLPLHPLIMVTGFEENIDPQSQQLSESLLEQQDPMRQRYSVTVHPRLPLIICSDGYVVTVMQLPGETTCLSLLRGLAMESTSHLKKIREAQKLQMNLYDSLLKDGRIGIPAVGRNGPVTQRIGLIITNKVKDDDGACRYAFEEAPDDLDTTADSEAGDVAKDFVTDLGMGKIVFGDVENLNATIDFKSMIHNDGLSVAEHMVRTHKALKLAWSMGVSHVGLWTLEHEQVIHNITDNTVKLFVALLNSSKDVFKEFVKLAGGVIKKQTRKVNHRLLKVLEMYKSTAYMLRFDMNYKHLSVSSLALAHSMINMLLTNTDIQKSEPRFKTLHGCYLLLKFSDTLLGSIYSTFSQRDEVSASLPFEIGPSHDVYGPPVCCKFEPVTKFLFEGSFRPTMSRGDVVSHEGATGGGVNCAPLGLKRLAISWRVLYKHIAVAYRHQLHVMSQSQRPDKVTKLNTKRTQHLLMTVQCRLHAMGVEIPRKQRVKVYPGEKHALDGLFSPAIRSWTQYMDLLPDASARGRRGTRVLLAILYSLLLQGQLRAAVEFVEFLIRQQDVKKSTNIYKQDSDTRISLLSLLIETPNREPIIPSMYIRSRAVKHTVQSLARVMAAYFSNRAIFVYPPHAPRKIPPLHVEYSIDHRVSSLYHGKLSQVIREEGLGDIWTPDRALQYYLLCGNLNEATWFADALGDWKTAFAMSVACQQHENMSYQLYYLKRKLRLPEPLHPHHILRKKLDTLFGIEQGEKSHDNKKLPQITEDSNMADLTKTLSDFTLAATMCEVDITPILLESLIHQLRHLVAQFKPLVAEGLYLPAPPVYSAQPPFQENDVPDGVLEEVRLRSQISSVLQLITLVLNCSHTTLPAARWYIHKVINAFAKGIKFKSQGAVEMDIEELERDYLSAPSVFEDGEEQASVLQLLSYFREMCTLMWLCYVRDQLSLATRLKAKMVVSKLTHKEQLTKKKWLDHCRETLSWAMHMLPFTRFIPDSQNETCGIILSLIVEFPANEGTAKLLAECIHNVDEMDPEIQDRLQGIMKDWQGVIIEKGRPLFNQSTSGEGTVPESPRGKSLSIYYEKLAHRYDKVLKKKSKTFGRYHEYVYDVTNEEPVDTVHDVLYVGSRAFESEEDYVKFLDVFYPVTFSKAVDAEKDNPTFACKPLLMEYAQEIREKELGSLVHQSISSLHRKQNISCAIESPRRMMTSSPRTSPRGAFGSMPPKSPRSKIGLLRSFSMSDIRAKSNLPTYGSVKESTPSANMELCFGEERDSRARGRERRKSKDSGSDSVRSKSVDRGSPSTSHHSNNEGTTRRSRVRRSNSFSNEKPTEAKSKLASPSKESFVDPLEVPVLQPWLLENMQFGERFSTLEQLLEWLSRWVSRNHSFGSMFETSEVDLKPSIRLHVLPKMILYSIWQLERNFYKSVARVSSPKPQRPEPVYEEQDLAQTSTPDVSTIVDESQLTDVTVTGLDEIDLTTNDPPVMKSSTPKVEKKKKKRRPKKKKVPTATLR